MTWPYIAGWFSCSLYFTIMNYRKIKSLEAQLEMKDLLIEELRK